MRSTPEPKCAPTYRPRTSEVEIELDKDLFRRDIALIFDAKPSKWPEQETCRTGSDPKGGTRLRRRRTVPGAVLRRAQHRDRFERQHLDDGDVRGNTRTALHVQGHLARHEGESGRGLAEYFAVDDDTFRSTQPVC